MPDVVILDNRMPDLGGIDVAAAMLERRPDQSVILFSAFLDDRTREQAAQLGVRACVSKDDINRLPEIIEEITGS